LSRQLVVVVVVDECCMAPLLLCVQECLVHIIAALDHHLDEVDIQTKALVLLGVLIQVLCEIFQDSPVCAHIQQAQTV
jgi:hypothetical protein